MAELNEIFDIIEDLEELSVIYTEPASISFKGLDLEVIYRHQERSSEPNLYDFQDLRNIYDDYGSGEVLEMIDTDNYPTLIGAFKDDNLIFLTEEFRDELPDVTELAELLSKFI